MNTDKLAHFVIDFGVRMVFVGLIIAVFCLFVPELTVIINGHAIPLNMDVIFTAAIYTLIVGLLMISSPFIGHILYKRFWY